MEVDYSSLGRPCLGTGPPGPQKPGQSVVPRGRAVPEWVTREHPTGRGGTRANCSQEAPRGEPAGGRDDAWVYGWPRTHAEP